MFQEWTPHDVRGALSFSVLYRNAGFKIPAKADGRGPGCLHQEPGHESKATTKMTLICILGQLSQGGVIMAHTCKLPSIKLYYIHRVKC